MRIVYSYQGVEKVFEQDASEIIIGRPEGMGVDLDLSPDYLVSPAHARLWIERGKCWLEDLGSTCGTQVNGEEIKGIRKRALRSGDFISIGETELKVEISASPLTESWKENEEPPDDFLKPLGKETPRLDADKMAYTSADSN